MSNKIRNDSSPSASPIRELRRGVVFAAVGSALLPLQGCKSGPGFAGCCGVVVIVGLVLFGLVAFANALVTKRDRATADRLAAESELRRQKELERSEQARRREQAQLYLGRAILAIDDWVPQCCQICLNEFEKGNGFQHGGAARRACSKSLDLIEGAEVHLRVLTDRDFTVALYRANEVLTQLRYACTNCPSTNSGQRTFRCIALLIQSPPQK